MKDPQLLDGSNPSILCVIDFSDSSLQVLQWAIPEAVDRGVHISVLYPYRLDQLKKKEDLVQSKKDIDRNALLKFERAAEQLLRDHHVSFDFRAEVGFISDRVRENIRKNKVILLVVDRKLALSNWESLQELIGEIEVPMVIVPQK